MSYLEDLNGHLKFAEIPSPKNYKIKETLHQSLVHEPQASFPEPLLVELPSIFLHRSPDWLRRLSYKSSMSEHLFHYFYPDL